MRQSEEVVSLPDLVVSILSPRLQQLARSEGDLRSLVRAKNLIFGEDRLAVLVAVSPFEFRSDLERFIALKSGESSGVGIILIPFALPTRMLAALVGPLSQLGIRIVSSTELDLAEHARRLIRESEDRLAAARARWEPRKEVFDESQFKLISSKHRSSAF
ncbi:hypothetical protein [Paraburkholderia sp. GAS333]|uniref:hypothetical protein n=1 Tax=Paraburkholderia sp. GAS333 TaxID=3156279 RepID=UPI003D2547F7